MGSYANAPSGNPYGPLLEVIYDLLTSSADLIALVPVANIGMNLRKSLTYPAVEFGVEQTRNEKRYRDNPRISLMVYGTESPEDTVRIADTVVSLIKPRNLTDIVKGVIVDRAVCTRYAVLPRDDYGVSISTSFSLKYTFFKE